MKPKRCVFYFRSPVVIDLLGKLQRGYKSAFMEAAVEEFLKSQTCQILIESFIKKQGVTIGKTGEKTKNDTSSILSKLKGDFE